MTTYDYIKGTLTDDQIRGLSRAGIIAPNTAQYIEIYAWHIANGRSKKRTAEHFGLKPSTTAYAISQMNKPI